MPAIVEVCVEGIASAIAAAEGGADRVELCSDLAVGGVTPGPGLMIVARRRLSIPVHVLVRPRGGDFVYSDDEFAAMEADVEAARAIGVDGVVLGLLDREGRIDPRTSRLIGRARPLSITFHKAFDEASNPSEALETLVSLGVDRVLTSGQAPTAIEGIESLRRFVRRGAGRIEILAGGRIRRAEIPSLLAAGLREIHVGSAACLDGITDASMVRGIVEAARSARPDGELPPGA